MKTKTATKIKMKSEIGKNKIGRMGVTGIELLVIGMALFVAAVIPALFLKIHLVEVVHYEYNYNRVQLMMLALLSTTHDGQPLQKIIGEHIVLNNHPDIAAIISSKMDKLANCYKVYYELGEGSDATEKILSATKDCEAKEYAASAQLTLPYNSNNLAAKLMLVIN